MNLLAPADTFLFLLNWVLLGLVAWSFIDAALRPAAAFPAAGKLTKPIWLAITGIGTLLCLLGVQLFGLFGGAIAVASLVYLLDVRPAVRGVAGGGPWR